jgi:hypothetical protein
MSTRALYRWSGVALIVGALLGVVGQVLETLLYHGHQHTPADVSSSGWMWVYGAVFLGFILITMGVPGLYLSQTTRAGCLGFAGFALLYLALLGIVSIVSIDTFILPILGQWAPASEITNPPPLALMVSLVILPILLQSIGGILLGLASMRARVLPRGVGILLIAQGILYFVVFPLPPSPLINLVQLAPNIAFCLACAWAGSMLIAQRQEAAVAAVITRAAVTAR